MNAAFVQMKKRMVVFCRSYAHLLYHTVAWLVFIAYELAVVIFITGNRYSWLHYFSSYLLNILLFYCHYAVLRHTLSGHRRRLALLVTLLCAELLAYSLLTVLKGNILLFSAARPDLFHIEASALVKSVWRGIYFMLLGTAYWLIKRFIIQKENIARLEQEKLHSILARQELEKNLLAVHNAWLQSRLNPHLLFNAFNFLYDAVYDSSPDAAGSVILLSDIMRYSLEETGEDGKVRLGSEIAHIKNYLALHQLMTRNRLNIETLISTDNPDVQIIPLVLLSFVENMFKHGNLADPGKPAVVQVVLENNRLEFYTRNTPRPGRQAGSGLGIANNRIRLENYYAGKFSLYLNNTEDTYSVQLTIYL